MADPARTLSIVVPVHDEAENVVPLLDRLLEVLRPLGRPFEVLFVDDGSTDDTRARLRARLADTPELGLVELTRNFGQTAALQAGFDRARGEIVVTLDGDGQNDPQDVPRLVARIDDGADAVSGWRRRRHDAALSRRLPSWLANALIRRLTGVPIHDHGCGLKAYRREVLGGLRLYSDMHRFVGLLASPRAGRVDEIDVGHRPRTSGRSKYGISRTLTLLADLAAVVLISRHWARPSRVFLRTGVPFGLAAAVVAAANVLGARDSVVLPALTFVLGLVFAWCVTAGVVSEALFAEPGSTRSRVPRIWRVKA